MSVAPVMVDAVCAVGLLFGSMPTDASPDLIRPSEAAAMSGVSVRTLSRYVAEGRLTAIRTVGGHFRYRRADIVAITTPTAVA